MFWVTLAFLWASPAVAEDLPLDFNRDVRPLLSDRCFACHGPDEATREAGLRLDQPESAMEDRGGYAAVVPGDVEASELMVRVRSDDPDLRMPPPEFAKALTAEEVAILDRWIRQDARYATHWSFAPLVRPALPAATGDTESNPIDLFIDRRLSESGLVANPPADPRTLIRRLSFDLTGLPADPAMVERFVADPSEEAYQRVVDDLLMSPHYGERMAMYWLDLVRYADSLGFHGDQERSVSPYRDYVINAFNQNMPFDQFTIEQLAGDLLPDPTLSQKVASTYNRLNRASGEGGGQPKEYLAKYSADRVRTTGSVWLGATVGCAECHDHKFDPFTAKDFYSLAAFFADIKEQGIVSGAVHIEQLPVPSDSQQRELDRLGAQIATAEAEYEARSAEDVQAFESWRQELIAQQQAWLTPRPSGAESAGGANLEVLADGIVQVSGPTPDTDTYTLSYRIDDAKPIAAVRLEVFPDPNLPGNGPGRAANGNFVLNQVLVGRDGENANWRAAFATHGQANFPPENLLGGKRDGWAILPETGKPQQLILVADQPLAPAEDESQTLRIRLVQEYGSGHSLGRFRLSLLPAGDGVDQIVRAPAALAALVNVDQEQTDKDASRSLWEAFRQHSDRYAPIRQRLDQLRQQRKTLEAAIPTTLVTTATTPREIRVLPRGDWMNDSGPVVEPAVPDFLPRGPLAGEDESPDRFDRLDLARWMVSRDNPLVARALVNRLWMLMFGNGLSRTVDDLGSQGEPPSHPELLDWLAVELIDSGWDIQHVLRTIVHSRAYQRSSVPEAEHRRLDPYNRLLARQSRFRLDAEMVRDNALAVSGLLVRDIGGKSVHPYQPPGYWSQLNFPQREYQNDAGADQYRRGVYTHWQRTFLHPSMLAFDAPAREECTARRERSNTPLQALVLLNDPTYVEAARGLARRVLTEADGTIDERLDYLFRITLARPLRPAEREVFRDTIAQNLHSFGQAPERAAELAEIGQMRVDPSIDRVQLAAWTAAARIVLNLHEMVMRY
jgi:hypothetical protein